MRFHGLEFVRRPNSYQPTQSDATAAGLGNSAPVSVWVQSSPPWDPQAITVETVARGCFSDGTLISALDRVVHGSRVWWHQRFQMDLGIACSERGDEVVLFGGITAYPDYLDTILTGTAAGLLRSLRGLHALHASSVLVDNKALVIAGQSGDGKSTTTAALALAGHPLITDDLVGWRETPEAIWMSPGPVRLKLYPAVLRYFGIDPEPLPRVRPNLEKRFCKVPVVSTQEEISIGAIYILSRSGGLRPGEIRPVLGSAAFIALKDQCRNLTILPPGLRANQFQALAALARRVPVRIVGAHPGLEQLPSFTQSLIEDLRRTTLDAPDRSIP